MKIKNLTSDGQSKRKLLAYIGIFTVVLVWGINPIITLELYRYYSPAFRLVAVNIILIPTYLILSAKHIRECGLLENRDSHGVVSGSCRRVAEGRASIYNACQICISGKSVLHYGACFYVPVRAEKADFCHMDFLPDLPCERFCSECNLAYRRGADVGNW